MHLHLAQLRQQGLNAFERKDYPAALEAFRAILAERPWFADIRHYTALCLGFMGRTEEALEQIDLAVDVNPRYVEAHINRALLLQELGRYEEARRAVERAGAHEQNSHSRFPAAEAAALANAHATLGDMYVQAGAPEEAVAQFNLALGLRPGFVDIRNKLGAALLAMGRIDAAVAEFRTVLDANPRFIGARLNLGLAWYRQARIGDAVREWQACEEQDPGNAQARAYLTMVEGSKREAEPD
jgi:tetratricopeptide (TPR) repeat protein